MRRVVSAAICAGLLALGIAAPARALAPIYTFIPSPPPTGSPTPPPTGYLYGPCGLAVSSSSQVYVSDYYHHAVDVFTSGSSISLPGYVTQRANVDPLDGPCGLAVDGPGSLYVNDFHRNVAKFGSLPSFTPGPIFDTGTPTGVAVDATNNVYVDDRTYVAVYDSNGNPVLDGPDPLKIGDGSIGDGYGMAVSQYPATAGYVLVPDASTNTVKVFNPAVSKTTPIQEIKDPSSKPFVSLRDSAIAVDKASGEIYFADNTQPDHAGRPQATIYVYGWSGSSYTWKGWLPFQIVDALPPGIAVDNTANPSASRVYVTSGNTTQAGWYAYPPGARIIGAPQPSSFSLSLNATPGSGSGAISANLAPLQCSSTCEEDVRSAAQVTLSATADPGSTFTGWSGGGCSGSDTCTVQMTQARSVSAGFEPAAGPPAPLGSAPSPSSTTATTASAAAKKAAARKHQVRKRRQAARRRAARRRRHHHHRVRHRHGRRF